MNEIILIGAGGHARSCIDVILSTQKYKIAGLIDKKGAKSKEVLGFPIIGNDDDLQDLRSKYQHAIVTIGQIKSPLKRIDSFLLLKNLDYNLPCIISPIAHVSNNSSIGEGSIIMHHSIINFNAKIGKNCIINNKALIEHDSNIGDHCHISTGAIINGNVSIEKKSFIGSGAIVRESIVVKSNSVIGAGSLIGINNSKKTW